MQEFDRYLGGEHARSLTAFVGVEIAQYLQEAFIRDRRVTWQSPHLEELQVFQYHALQQIRQEQRKVPYETLQTCASLAWPLDAVRARRLASQ